MKPRKNKRPECIKVIDYSSLIPLRRSVTIPRFPKIWFSNVRSMVSKLYEISASISTELYDVVVITETWLNSRVTDELIVYLAMYRVEGIDRITNAGAVFVPISIHN